MDIKIVARNRKAGFEYFLLERVEAGLVLHGSEIKSIRNGQISLSEAFVETDGDQAWLQNAHIAPYAHASHYQHDPKRPKKLLLHRREIIKLWNETRKKGVTIIPTMVYLKNGKAKVEIALAKGKHLYDKREIIAKRDIQRDANQNNYE